MLLSGPARAEVQPAQAQGTGGPHAFFPESVFDFGTVTVGATVKHTFTFTNTGDQALEITDVKSTCGCTTAGAWSRRTEPGKSGSIPVEFHTGHFNGPVVKEVTVTCNEPNKKNVVLRLQGVVWHPIAISPAGATFSGVLDNPTNMFRTIRITNQEDYPLILREPKSNQRAVAAEILTNEPGKSYELTVKLVPPLGAGHVFGEISIPTSSTNMPVITVPVWAIAQPAVMVLPGRLELPVGPFTNQVSRAVSVRNNDSAPLELSDVTVSAKGVEAKVYELQKGQNLSVVLSFPVGFAAKKGETFELSFKSNNPKFSVVKVPITVQ